MKENTNTILILEDDRHAEKLIAYSLTSRGFKAITVSTGTAGLEMLSQQRVDLIISDVKMPEMDGYTFRQKILANPEYRHIPFIFVTANAQVSEQIRGMELGVDGYITKPFDPQVLVSKVEEVLGKQAEQVAGTLNDPSTGLLNSDAFETAVKRELKRIQRYKERGCLAILELDDFTEINDRHGQQTGNLVLLNLVQILKNNTRSTDLIGRYGEDRFLYYILNADIPGAQTAVTGLLKRLNELVLDGIDRKFSFSAGIAQVPQDGMDYNTILTRAKTAAQKARERGKNCVVVWEENMSLSHTGNTTTPVAKNGSLKILVADDEGHIRRLVAFTLRESGHFVTEVTDSDQALDYLESERPDLIILDIMMPGSVGGGIAVVKRMRASKELADIPIIIISAYLDQLGFEPEDLITEHGVDALIWKPFQLDELLSEMDRVMAKSRAKRQGQAVGVP